MRSQYDIIVLVPEFKILVKNSLLVWKQNFDLSVDFELTLFEITVSDCSGFLLKLYFF